MEQILTSAINSLVSSAFSDGGGGTSALKPNTNSAKSISQLMKGA